MCVYVIFFFKHQYAPLASNGTRAFCWGLHPEWRKSCGFHLRARGHVRKNDHGYVHVCMSCMRAVYGICARPRVQFFVLCHSVYRGQWSWRVRWACRRFSDFRMYARLLRTTKIRRTGSIAQFHSTDIDLF